MVINWDNAVTIVPEDARHVHARSPFGADQSGFIGVNPLSKSSADDFDINGAMERYADGDDRAFSQLYDLIAPRLYGFLLRKTRNESEAEDLLQQTLLRMHCARGRFIRGAMVMPWAISIARRLLIDRSRRDKPQWSDEAAENLDLKWALEAIDCPADEALHAKEVVQMVERVLSTLPHTQRSAFELVKQDGLTHAEAAQVLGTTVTAVKLRAHRTYETLRLALAALMETRGS